MWVTRLPGGPRKVNHAAVTIDDKIYCFGGYCSGEDFEINRPMEVCVLNTDTLRWKVLPPSGIFHEDSTCSDVPFHRYGHSAVVWKEVVYIWGGRNDSSGACNTLYRYDTVTGLWSRPSVHGLLPQKRDGHAAAIIGDYIYVFGGFEEAGDRFSSELYAYHIPTSTWSHLVPSGDRPMPRDFATMEPIGDKLYLWGGRGDLDSEGQHTGTERYENMLHVYDVVRNAWSVTPILSAPAARRSHASFVYNEKMYVFGGFNGRDHFNDLWVYRPDIIQWEEITFDWSPVIPNPRRRMSCCTAGERLFMFGGTSPQPARGDDVPLLAGDSGLEDHDDLFVFEFMPKLRTLAMVAILNHKLPVDNLPTILRIDFLIHTTPNTISLQQRIRNGNHSG